MQRFVRAVVVLNEVDSTNDELMRRADGERHGVLAVAETQTSGKARRGRAWHSPAGNIFMSFGWHFENPPASLAVLGPAAGICTCKALARAGLEGHGVKWPNDIMVSGAKLGGILVELRNARPGCDAVVGIGVNVRLAGDAASTIDQPWTHLAVHEGMGDCSRNRVIAMVVEELLHCFTGAAQELSEFVAASWSRWDTLDGGEVRVDRGDTVFEGTARGISPAGALRLRVTAVNGVPARGKIMEFHSGEVSVRRA